MMSVFGWLKRKFQERKEAVFFERQVLVRCNESGIFAAYPAGEIQSISWSAVTCIAIETNDGGPWGADLWWLIEGHESRCVYPGGATGDIEALAVLESLFPGFSDETVIKANGCTSNARFVCWQGIPGSNNSVAARGSERSLAIDAVSGQMQS
jgi:hypothetical protein